MSNTPPTMFDLAPENSATLVGSGAQACMGFLSSFALTNSVGLSAVGASTAVAGMWIYGRYTSKELRGGNLLWAPKEGRKSTSGYNSELSEYLKKKGLEGAQVIETQSYQNIIYEIAHDDAAKMKALIPNLSLRLNLDVDTLTFKLNYRKGTSAIFASLDEKKWEGIPYQPGMVDSEGFKVFVGKSIYKDTIAIDHSAGSGHVLVAGTSGSGKTQLLKVLINEYLNHVTNPEVYLFNPKQDLAAYADKAAWYTQSSHEGLSKLAEVSKLIDERQSELSKLGYDNFFDALEEGHKMRPIVFILDEYNELVREDQKRAMSILWRLMEMARSAGVFIVAATQKPKATSMPTELRDNFATRIVLAVADAAAETVVGAPKSRHLPFDGAMMVKVAKKPGWTIGRSAFISGKQAA